MKQRKRKKFLSLRRLKKAVRVLSFASEREYFRRYKEILGAPSDPHSVYKNKGWKGYPDLLGANGIRNEKLNQKHGESRVGHVTPEYRSWKDMMYRCFHKKSFGYPWYGGANPPITVCLRWRTFENFLADMGRKPSAQHTLGRFGDAGNYKPGNCAWQTWSEQMAERIKKRNSQQLPLAA